MTATVKELLKSDSICKSYGQMKKGPAFLQDSHLQIQLYSPFGRIKIKYKHSQTRMHNKKHTEHKHACTLVIV